MKRDPGRDRPATLGKLQPKDREPPPPRSSGFPIRLGSHGPRTPGRARASLRQSPTGPSPKTTESCTTAAPRDRPAPGPHRLPRGGGGAGGRGERGPGARRAGGAAAATAAFVSPGPCLPTSGAAGEGGRDSREGRPGGRGPHPRRPHAGYCPRLCVVRASRGRRESSLRPRRQDDASVFVFPELAGGLPSPGRRHPRPARAPPEGQGPRAHPGRHAPPGALPLRPTLTLREQEAGAGPARDAGAVGPGRSLRRASRTPCRGPGAGRSRGRGWRCRRRGGLLLFQQEPRAWPGRGGAREVGGGKRGGGRGGGGGRTGGCGG